MQTSVDPVSGYPNAALIGSDTSISAVSWPAIAAGTVVAAAASLLLVALGAGAGFGAVSPWPNAGASATSFTMMTAIAFIVIQWLSAGIGGYVTGRLRTKWAALHTHEVFFRDTAHGLITWATATLLMSGAAAMIGASTTAATAHVASAAGAAAAIGAANHATPTPSIDPYDVDTLLRPATPDTQSTASESVSNDMRLQSARILAAGLAKGDVPAADQAYLTQVVGAQARISPGDASARVDAMVAKIKADHDRALQTADSARKAAEAASIFTAFAMLLGAFIACIAAALGGHRRDMHA
jgi:hypothetical protein